MTLPFIWAISSTFTTFLGGFFVLRFRNQLRIILSLSAGALLGVSFFDLLPSASRLTEKSPLLVLICMAGFGFYFLINHWIKKTDASRSGDLGALSLVLHSVLDGVSIGLAFKASHSVGIAVALAVITHDFSDGVNTVSVVMRSKNAPARACAWLALDGVAPVLGVTLTSFFQVRERTLGFALAAVAGCLLYIAIIDLLPECLGRPSRLIPAASILLGIAIMYGVVYFDGV
jgi:ZIP family zinc transporter